MMRINNRRWMAVVVMPWLAFAAESKSPTKPSDIPPPAISLEQAVKKALECSPVKPGDKSTYGVYYVGGAGFSAMPEKIDGKIYDRHWRITITSSGVGEGALHFVNVYEDGRCEHEYGK